AEGLLGELVHGLVDEGKAAAHAAGVELGEDPWEMNVLATQRGHAHRPSMLEDVEAHRRTEIELITGALVREAGRAGGEVPLHTEPAIAATAHAFAAGCVATVQNGLGNEETLALHVERVIRGTTFPAGKIVAPGHVHWDVKGDTTLGPYEPRPAPLAAVHQLAD